MNNAKVARRVLDSRFEAGSVRHLTRPHRGWVRAIREALGMSVAELGQRMGVSRQRAAQIEASEQRGSLRLDTLERAAEAMDCDLVYAMVPRTSLEQTVTDRARSQAQRVVGMVSHHGLLEDQGLGSDELRDQVEEVARELVDTRGLWTDSE